MRDQDTRSLEEPLSEAQANPDPIKQFHSWFERAKAAGIAMPEAMTLATADSQARPSARMVLLKQADQSGFVFFTNYSSRKALELETNPVAALVFYWKELDYQVRVEGTIERTSATESDEYFATRPRESQLGAHASPQSETVADRDVLERRFAALVARYGDQVIPRPENWGGYRLRPERIEFWKARSGRLHDRLLYERQPNGAWKLSRLAP